MQLRAKYKELNDTELEHECMIRILIEDYKITNKNNPHITKTEDDLLQQIVNDQITKERKNCNEVILNMSNDRFYECLRLARTKN